jgi:replicative DNA helicase
MSAIATPGIPVETSKPYQVTNTSVSISDLISKCVVDGDLTQLKRVRQNVIIDPGAVKAIMWLLEFEEKYGKAPSIESFKSSDVGLYFNDYNYDWCTPEECFDQAMEREHRKYASQVFDLFDGKNIDFLLESTKVLSASYDKTKIESVSKFDVDDLFTNLKSTYLGFGIPTFDREIGGLDVGQYALAFAGTGVGKTWYLCFTAIRAALGGNKVLLMTKEMSKREIMKRLSAIAGGFNPSLFKKLNGESDVKMLSAKLPFVKHKWKEIIEKCGGDIKIPDEDLYTPNDIDNWIEKEYNESGSVYDLVLVDGINHLRQNGNKGNQGGGENWQELKTVSAQLRDLAMQKGRETRVIGTSQLSTAVDVGKSGGFSINDIGYSKAIAQDTYVSFVLAKGAPTIAINKNESFLVAEIIKNRDGVEPRAIAATEMKIDFENMELRFKNDNYKDNWSFDALKIER